MSIHPAIALFALCCVVGSTQAAELTPEEHSRYAALEKSLTGSALVGHFTVTGKETSDPRAERYEIAAFKHVGEGNWLIIARIKYGDHDVTLPITLPIKWAGDTPVITVDKMAFPGLGTYTARVMIHDDHYAGFWSGGDHGGHLYGVVEHDQTVTDGHNKSQE